MNTRKIKLAEKELTISYSNIELEQFEEFLSKKFGVHSVTSAFNNESVLTSRRFHIAIIQIGLQDNHPEIKVSEIRDADPAKIIEAAMVCVNLVGAEMYPREKKIETRGQGGKT